MNEGPVKTADPSPTSRAPDLGRDLLAEAQDYIRRNPTRALAIAAGAGFVLKSAPVGRLVGGLLRVSFSLLPPALMMVGGVKIWERIQRRQIL